MKLGVNLPLKLFSSFFKISDLVPMVIPVKATVIGCPLKFQMATLEGQIPVVRFGTHVCGVPAVQRPLKVINNSPYG